MAGAAAALIVSGVLSACGNPAVPSSAVATSTSAGALTSVHTQEAAERFAEALLERATTPPGSTPLAASPPPVRESAPSPSTPNLASRHRFEAVPMPSAAAVAFLSHTIPPGFAQAGVGGITSATATGYVETNVTDRLVSVPDGVFSANLVFQVPDAPGSTSLVRIDAQVTWLPPKSTDDKIPVEDRVAVVSLTEAGSSSSSPRDLPAPSRFVVDDPAQFDALVAAADALPTALPGTRSCPNDAGTRFRVAFGRDVGAAADVTFTAGFCGWVTVIAHGGQSDVLSDGPAFRAAYRTALGLPTD